MDNSKYLKEVLQQVIDETNLVLARWAANGFKFGHDEIQGLFLSILKSTTKRYDWVFYHKVCPSSSNKPICYLTDNKISRVYSRIEFVQSVFDSCNFTKDVQTIEKPINTLNEINFNSINRIKFN